MEVAPTPRCLLPAWVEAALVSETGAARLRFPALNISWSPTADLQPPGPEGAGFCPDPKGLGALPPSSPAHPCSAFSPQAQLLRPCGGGSGGGPQVLGHQLFLYIKSFFT